jgi:hypothetical protein
MGAKKMKLYKHYSLIHRDPVYFNEHLIGVYNSAKEALEVAERQEFRFFTIEPWRKPWNYNESPSVYEMKEAKV